MDKLPLEILHRVFIQLPWTQRRACILVCRHWRNVMKASDLLCNNTFYIKNERNEQPMLSNFLSTVNQKPDLAFQVEYLTIDLIPDDYDTRILIDLFPNIKKLVLIRADSGILKPSTYFDSLDRSPLELKSRSYAGIEYLQDFCHCELTRLLILNGLCSRLEKLVLNVCTIDETPSDIFALLKNMPVLKSLTVDHSPLTIDTFEMIHANVPSLESLCLMGVDLLESELPQNIQPALLMTRLDIWIYDDDHAPKTNWLRYIHKKYTNIMHFNFNVDVISYCRELKNIFSAEYPVLLQSVGPQLESLRLSPYLDRGYQSIRTLGAVNCRIKSMDMCLAEDMGGFDALAETSSFKYIENLDLSKVDIDLELHRLKEMSSLKTLTIYFDELEPLDIFGEDQTEEIQTYTERVTIDMNSFFRQLPSTLESVVIGMAFAKFDNEKIDENFDVKKLEFHHITPKGGRLDQFIWNHFPNVHSLALVDSFQSDERIMLPNCHFTLLQVSKYFTELNVRLITKDETRFFSTREQLKKARPDFKGHLVPVSESDIEDWPCMTIICASVEKLFISGIEACLKSDKVESQS